MSADLSDRELLERAAKAAGIDLQHRPTRREFGAIAEISPGYYSTRDPCTPPVPGTVTWHWWNPLTDDGDALRLAVRRRFHINIFSATNGECFDTPGFVEIWLSDDSDPIHVELVTGNDYEAATRRAITRAAAALGE